MISIPIWRSDRCFTQNCIATCHDRDTHIFERLARRWISKTQMVIYVPRSTPRPCAHLRATTVDQRATKRCRNPGTEGSLTLVVHCRSPSWRLS